MSGREVSMELEKVSLPGTLDVPRSPKGLVLFAHGSGSSRHSERNRFVAERLRDGDLATLLFDLLTEEEQRVDTQTRELRFDIGLLAERLEGAIEWSRSQDELASLPVGLFGASTGAAAALVAAADRPDQVGAVVARGGRPDLAKDALEQVKCPTLFIVGERDPLVLELNQAAAERIRGNTRLEIVPRATHLFEEPGALEQVAELARTELAAKL